MYKLKYTLLLPIVMMYAASTCAMNRTTQLGRRAAASTSRLTSAGAATLNRPFATSTARVTPTWQQAPVAQQSTAGVQPFAANATNCSLATAQGSRQSGGSGGESFYDRYKKYGLSAAIASFWAAETKELSAKDKDEDARTNMFNVCGYTNTTVNQALDGDSTYFLPELREKSPKCARALSDFCSARIALLLEQLRGKSLSEAERSKYVKEIENLYEIQSFLK